MSAMNCAKSGGWMQVVTLLVSAAALATGCSQTPGGAAREKCEPVGDKDRRMAWWREAKFGMFIHWGIYAVPAGRWHEEPIPGIGEWIMHRAQIPIPTYEKLAGQFNPVKFNADEWVRIARDAGMKYIVITSKHHDGFAMFASKASTYNIVDATPFKRDPMKELADACKRHGLRLCFYYSHAQDWHEPDAVGNVWDFPAEKGKTGPKDGFDEYMKRKALPQVREILTQYGPIGLIWYDTPTRITREQSEQFVQIVRDLQPDCLINSRVGYDLGDYGSEDDNKIPDDLRPGDWETPATINDTWAFKSYDHNWKSVEDLTFKLVDIVSKGGNYLLNVGPTAEGVIPQASVERLREMGKWLRVNGESVYGCGPTPFRTLIHRCTTRPGRIYVHVFEYPLDKRLVIRHLKNKVNNAYLLADPWRRPLSLDPCHCGVTVQLPDDRPDPVNTVVVLEIDGPPLVDEPLPATTAAKAGNQTKKK
ncbi:MAG TPA: alpha-L-fucosidase [Phycisphaerae bacterium]|nr:alpha-L-fucosidase [Phycisphaerae bacterium]